MVKLTFSKLRNTSYIGLSRMKSHWFKLSIDLLNIFILVMCTAGKWTECGARTGKCLLWTTLDVLMASAMESTSIESNFDSNTKLPCTILPFYIVNLRHGQGIPTLGGRGSQLYRHGGGVTKIFDDSGFSVWHFLDHVYYFTMAILF